jgi:hypothetical protein
MAFRITRKFVEMRFESVAKVVGWKTTCWERVEDRNVAQIGAVCLDHNATYGGWSVEQIVTEGGGVRVLNGGKRMSHSELIAWLDGVLLGFTVR